MWRHHAGAAIAVPLGVAAAIVMSACASSELVSDRHELDGTSASAVAGPTPPSRDDVSIPVVDGPITGGGGRIILGPESFDLATVGYLEEEYFLSGTATAYTSSSPLSNDGRWMVRPEARAPYTTRVVVRRPSDPARFSGTVVVEWLNVSGGLDADPDWTFLHVELIRSGHAWVGVSAQEGGIEGGTSPVGVPLTLKSLDPVRYGDLVHPGDDYSFDLFSQAGAAVWFESDTLLGGTDPQYVLGIGESQSAGRLTTYVNGVAPLVDVFDGYLIHSRGAAGASLATEPRDPVPAPSPTFLREDLDVPVLVFSTETDLAGERRGYTRARQPDTRRLRGWEVAGTAHADAYLLGVGDTDDGSGVADLMLFAAMTAPPRTVYGGAINCDLPINAGPQVYVLRAALDALDRWVRTGEPPPKMPRLELDPSGDAFLVDDLGVARGGIRTPHADVPIARLSGLGQSGESFCRLFGTTLPLDQGSGAHPDHATFVERWTGAVDRAVAAGVVLEADSERLKAAAMLSNAGA